MTSCNFLAIHFLPSSNILITIRLTYCCQKSPFFVVTYLRDYFCSMSQVGKRFMLKNLQVMAEFSTNGILQAITRVDDKKKERVLLVRKKILVRIIMCFHTSFNIYRTSGLRAIQIQIQIYFL